MPAAIGNQYAAKARMWCDAIKRALAKRSKTNQMEALDDLAEKLLDLCMAGDLGALKELGDRLDGRPQQQVIATDEEGRSLAIAIISYTPTDTLQVQSEALPGPSVEGSGLRH